MGYIGNRLADSYTSFAKQDFTTSATTNYVLDQAVANANDIALFINFVRQEPTTAYTASGTTLTLTSATVSGDDMYCIFLGKALQTVNPPAGSVGASQITDGTIGLAKLSATGTKDATTFLRGDNTFASAGGTNTPMFQAVMSGNQSLSAGSTTKVTFNSEIFDTNSNYDSSTNYRFTPTVAGKYKFYVSLQFRVGGSSLYYCYAYIYKNGSLLITSQNDFQNSNANTHNATVSYIVSMNGSSDYVEAYGHVYNAGTIGATDGGQPVSVFSGYKIIE